MLIHKLNITSASEIKFLGLTIDDTVSSKKHIEQVLNKMCTACYPLRNKNRHVKSNQSEYIGTTKLQKGDHAEERCLRTVRLTV